MQIFLLSKYFLNLKKRILLSKLNFIKKRMSSVRDIAAKFDSVLKFEKNEPVKQSTMVDVLASSHWKTSKSFLTIE